MLLRQESLGEDFKIWSSALTSVEPEHTALKVARSTIAQLGGDLLADDRGFEHRDKNDLATIQIPVDFAAYARPAKTMFDCLRELVSQTPTGEAVTWNGQVLPIGRVILLSMFRELEGDQVERQILDGFVGFDDTLHPEPDSPRNYKITSSGRLMVKMAERQYQFDEEELLETPEKTLATLHEGRQRLERLANAERRDPTDCLPDFTLSGIRISPGSLHLGLDTQVYNSEGKRTNFEQIYGGHFIDAGRIAGIGKHLKSYNRHRQVELRRVRQDETGDMPQTYGDTWLGVKVYEPLSPGGPHDWIRKTADERREIHVNGISTLRAIEAEEPSTHEALLEAVKPEDIGAIILKRSGGTIVGKRGTKNDDERAILRAFKEFPDGLPPRIQHLAPHLEALDAAGDKTNLLITEEMEPGLMPHYVKRRGVSAFLFNRSASGPLMDVNDMTSLASLVRSGIGIAKVEDGQYREFHPSGLWTKPGVAKKLLHREDAFAIFGANRGEIGKAYRADIDWFLDQAMFEVGGPEGLSVITGGGDGIMLAGHLSARERRILSIVSSITSEKPEVDNLAIDADALNEVISLYLFNRQAQLENMYTQGLVFPGGYGSVYEAVKAATERKLLHKLPTSLYVINEGGYYDGLKHQFEAISSHSVIRRKGCIYNVGGRPDSPRKWQFVHFVEHVEEAFDRYKQFRRDPIKEWSDMGAKPAQIDLAYTYNLMQSDFYAFNLPPYLDRAAREFTGRRPR